MVQHTSFPKPNIPSFQYSHRGEAHDNGLIPLLVTRVTIGCNRFGDTHRFMALHALSVISRHQSGFKGIFCIKRFTVTADALRGCFGGRAVMMTALADRTFFKVKVVGQLIGFDIVHHLSDDFAVRKFYRIILAR